MSRGISSITYIYISIAYNCFNSPVLKYRMIIRRWHLVRTESSGIVSPKQFMVQNVWYTMLIQKDYVKKCPDNVMDIAPMVNRDKLHIRCRVGIIFHIMFDIIQTIHFKFLQIHITDVL